MNKLKRINLLNEYVEGASCEIICEINPNDTFNNVGHIHLHTKEQHRNPISRKRIIRNAPSSKKHQSKRRRNLGFIPISFKHPNCIWHHVDHEHVVACPENIHRLPHTQQSKLEGVLG